MTITTKSPDRIRLPLKFDAEKMRAEITSLNLDQFIYYNVIPLRGPAHTIDTSLPFPPPAENYADGSWCDWLNTKELKGLPYILSIVDDFQAHTDVTLVRILRLAAGEIVKEHSDPTLGLEVESSVIRLTIPILNGDGVEFILNNKMVPMKPGECWYLKLTDPHSVINNSDTERINLTIDMIPNEWVRSLIRSSE